MIIDIYTLNEIYLDIKINDSINISNQIYNNFDIKYDDDFPKICFPLNEYNNNENNLNYEEGINKLFLPGYKNGQLVEFTIKKNLRYNAIIKYYFAYYIFIDIYYIFG